MAKQCCLPTYGSCCCNCKHHLRDRYYCGSTGWLKKWFLKLKYRPINCICGIPRGWICANPEFYPTAQSEWSEHGMCESFETNGQTVGPVPLKKRKWKAE